MRDYGYLSTLCQFHAQPKIALRIPPGAFRPPPKVKSALVGMTLPGERANLNITGEANEKRFLEFVQACFSQKRKTLRNNLLAIASDKKIHEALAAAALRPDARAEQLTLAAIRRAVALSWRDRGSCRLVVLVSILLVAETRTLRGPSAADQEN